MTTLKICSKCKVPQSHSCFSKNRAKFDGLQDQCKKCKAIGNKKWKQENPEKVRALALAYHFRNRDASLARMKRWYYSDLEKHRAKVLQWYKENPEKNRLRARNYRKSNPELAACRDMLKGVLQRLGLPKTNRTHAILGYSPKDLKEHLEKQFVDGMSWENRHLWHIDHKKSVASFIKEGVFDPKIINALDNLQPLWAEDNIRKGSGL